MSRVVTLFCIAAAMMLFIFGVSCNTAEDNEFKIVSSVFVPYDFARTIAGERARVSQLLPPGAEGHDWEPPAKVLRELSDADLFIYVGGGGDKWAETLLSSADIKAAVDEGRLRVLCLYDKIDVSSYCDGHTHTDGEHDHDIDTHFWTSPVLAKVMANAIADAITESDASGADIYGENLSKLSVELDRLDEGFRTIAQSEGRLYFGDRFAFYYLCREYGIDYLSPYAGCSDNAQPIDKVVVQMKEEVRRGGVRYIFCEEYNSASTISASIAAECGAEVRELHSCHNRNKTDATAGVTYIELMERNLELIKQALASDIGE